MGFWDQKNNPIVNKSKIFAIHIINVYKYLISEKKEYVLSNQVLRSGTSIGANVREAQRGQSTPDFYAKMNIALKEADETAYWLELLYEGKYLDEDLFTDIYEDCEEIIRILVHILKKNYAK
jgi:four helix bundle protein